jgi:hypothetical protein
MIVNVKTINNIIALGMPVRSQRLAIDDVALSPGLFDQHHHFTTQPFMLERLMRKLC